MMVTKNFINGSYIYSVVMSYNLNNNCLGRFLSYKLEFLFFVIYFENI